MGDIPLLPFSTTLLLSFLFAITFCQWVSSEEYAGQIKEFTFNINMKKISRLCHKKSMVTVNNMFPGPPIYATEGDRLIIKVVNNVAHNITIHWHGIRQYRTAWADGPAYITQCPIQNGHSYVYNFSTEGQRGTLFWHAHHSWLRSSVYGALIILPKPNVLYPFPTPFKEVPIIFGEWFNSDTEEVIKEALLTGGGPIVSDAYTINGRPGPLYACSEKDTFKLRVKPRKTYLLRFINAALNDELLFGIADHKLTVVEADANYVKPFTTNILHLAPGQTINVLLKTKPAYPNATYFILAAPYNSGQAPFDNTTVAGILDYKSSNPQNTPLLKPNLPPTKATDFVAKFTKQFRSSTTSKVPKTVDENFFFTVGIGSSPCPLNTTCKGFNGLRFSSSVNNVSFSLPETALLEAYYFNKSEGVYETDFPHVPINPYNFTGPAPVNGNVLHGTKVVVLPFNTRVEVVLQDTSFFSLETHPVHIHGYNFFLVGQGTGNFDPEKDPKSFNLVDPVERNTVSIPYGGWAAVRFQADNPGVWFMHCHIEIHMSWGLGMAWIVLDGDLPHQKLLPPPVDRPSC